MQNTLLEITFSKKEKATLLESVDFKLRAEAPATH